MMKKDGYGTTNRAQ